MSAAHTGGTTTAGAGSTAFRADIQGMRALAVLVVVLYHIDLVPGGYVGVDVFFVISGFLMGGLLLREAEQTGRVSLRNFFTRRSRRLLPALAVTVLATMVIAFFVAPVRSDFRTVNQTATGTSLFIANVRLFQLSGDYFAPIAERNPLLHTWSLSVEEQFYFAFPIVVAIVFLLLRRNRGLARRTLVTVIAAAGAASLVLNIALTDRLVEVGGISRPRDFAFFGPVARVWEFAAGILLAAWLLRSPAARETGTSTRLRAISTLGAVAGIAAIIATTAVLDDNTPFPGAAAIIPVAGTVLLLAAAPRAVGLGAVLSSRPAVVIGDLSYGWYLWHWPLIVFTRTIWGDAVVALIGAALVSLAVAAISYRFVEERFRRDQRIVGRRALALAACCIVVPVAVSLAGARLADSTEARLNRRYDLRRADPPPIRDDGNGLHVVLVGDSHAKVLVPSLTPILDEAGISLTRRTRAGCQFLVGVTSNLVSCKPWQERTLQALLDEPPDVVVITGYTVGRTTEIIAGKRRPIPLTDYSGKRARTEAEALELYRTGLTSAVDQLTAAGSMVILISSVPDFWTTPFDHVSSFDVLTKNDSPHNEQRAIDDVRRRTGGILAIEQQIASSNPKLRVIDPIPVLCGETCQQVENGVVIYRDHSHVAHAGAVRLAEAVLAEIRTLTGTTQ